MKNRSNILILIFISTAILATIGLQLRWNIKNYHENKRLLRHEIQAAFDNGIENYYADNAKKQIVLFANDSLPRRAGQKSIIHDSLRTTISYSENPDGKEKLRIIQRFPQLSDSSSRNMSVRIIRSDGDLSQIKAFTNRILVSMLRDSVRFEKLDSLVGREFARRKMDLSYGFVYQKPDGHKQRFFKSAQNRLTQNMLAQSTYLPPGSRLKLYYSDPSGLALQRSSAEIILSLLFSLAIIGCLLFLLRIINRQKKIEEIRNDLISNMTHEFKTPITTMTSAIEGIRSFNTANDPLKTGRYLDISENQLAKLSTLVEKLLETATLDTDALTLDKKPADLVALLKNTVEKFQLSTAKTLTFETSVAALELPVDAFHLENVFCNLIDNAVKYGGESINVQLVLIRDLTEITVADDGRIASSEAEKIFEKFYRIPSGNLHEVKGFGIGLYYARKIAEKHGGSLVLIPSGPTIFKLTLHG